MGRPPAGTAHKAKRTLSAEAREKIAIAQRKRWAKQKKPTVTKLPPKHAPVKRPRKPVVLKTKTALHSARPVEDKFSSGSRRDAILSTTHEDRETYVLFKRPNLLADRGLGAIDPFCRFGEVLSFVNRDKVFKMAKLHRI